MSDSPSLKLQTARTLKWNLIDKIAAQVLYAVTGIILARELNQEAFGLVGAILVFQAFASLLVDSGFSYALLQKKSPTRLDYSSVLWFNIGISIILYIILFLCARFIADLFGADSRLVPLSRVMFLSFIINGATIVQTNRFMKKMNVRPIAVANFVGLSAGAVVGIWMAFTGFEAWAIVCQTLTIALMKGLVLWIWSGWLPLLSFSWLSLRSFFKIGGSMMFTSFLNTLFLNIYSFFVGNRVGLVALGYYTQSDKWSKMGISSMSQVFTSTFIPVLSKVQDDSVRFERLCYKMNRLTAYLVFPIFIGLIVEARPIFHVLFGSKWDPSIILFQLLLIRGIFTVFTSLYTNYLLALGHASTIARLEVWRDLVAIAGLVATFPVMAVSLPDNPVWGVSVMLYGQIAAAVVAWVLTVYYVKRKCNISASIILKNYIPYMLMSCFIGAICILTGLFLNNDWLELIIESIIGIAFYVSINYIANSTIQKDAFSYLRGKM